MNTDRSALDKLLDVVLYAPAGLAVDARKLLPELAEVGRRRVAQDLTTARMIGQLAITQGSRWAQEELRRWLRPSEPTPAGGMRDDDDVASAPSTMSSRPPGASSAASATAERPEGPWVPREEGGVVPAPTPSADELPIPGYDTLAASQVMQRLVGLSHDELDRVRRYEQATRARKTVLLRIAQLEALP